MNQTPYIIIDIETIPRKPEEALDAEEQKKLINPIDSKIVAIGIKHNNQNHILMDEDETQLLTSFWKLIEDIKAKEKAFKIVGFNIKTFDIPFIITRSFILNIKIIPFFLSSIIDLRDVINAYRYGPSRGKLKEFGELLGIPPLQTDGHEISGENVAELWETDRDKLKQYLEHDLLITQALFKRAEETGIILLRK